MTDLERLLRVEGAPPDHGTGFEGRLWAAIAADCRRDDEKVAGRVSATGVSGRHRTRLLVAMAAAAAIAALAVGIAVSRHGVEQLASPPLASAAEVAANVRNGLAGIHTLRADCTGAYRHVTGPPRSEWRDDWTTADWWARARIAKQLHVWPTSRVIGSSDGR
jgi:hypothetical protein